MNRWRADQDQPLQPTDAIIALLTKALASQGYLNSEADRRQESGIDPLASAFEDFIARTL